MGEHVADFAFVADGAAPFEGEAVEELDDAAAAGLEHEVLEALLQLEGTVTDEAHEKELEFAALAQHALQVGLFEDAERGGLQGVSEIPAAAFADEGEFAKYLAGGEDGFGDLLTVSAVGTDLDAAATDEEDLLGGLVRQVNVIIRFELVVALVVQHAHIHLFGAEDILEIDVLDEPEGLIGSHNT